MLSSSGRKTFSALVLSFTQAVLVPTGVVLVALDEVDGVLAHPAKRRAPAASAATGMAQPAARCRRLRRREGTDAVWPTVLYIFNHGCQYEEARREWPPRTRHGGMQRNGHRSVGRCARRGWATGCGSTPKWRGPGLPAGAFPSAGTWSSARRRDGAPH